MNDSSLVTLFLISFLLGWGPALAPGPTLRLTVEEFPRRGTAAALHAWFVQVAAELAFCAVVIGIALLIGGESILTGALVGLATVTFLGAGWLLVARSSRTEVLGGDRARASETGRTIFAHALEVLRSPFWWAWWILAGAFLVVDALGNQTQGSALRFVCFYAGFTLPALIWNLVVARSLHERWSTRWGRPTYIAYRWNRVLVSLAGTFLAVRGLTLLYDLVSQAALQWARQAWPA
ncbi:MAG: hypothetical protein RL885_08935 [Planctomycetota bacterium]